ncbi:hypothetical protein LGM45_02415 [Burkholderia cepacia]|uniref:hypothetical protein n=1 Tax=Burkholderia cepacia TaxID=292 RepID=UPI001CF38190|nr:hypothetical protein [Burkholderia cepacia]MCA7927873.1 hypothetical protein [Burkholderia cepacia]
MDLEIGCSAQLRLRRDRRSDAAVSPLTLPGHRMVNAAGTKRVSNQSSLHHPSPKAAADVDLSYVYRRREVATRLLRLD